MTEMVSALQILGDVCKRAEVVRVLGGAGDVPDLMLCNYGLMETEMKRVLTGNQPLMEAKKDKCSIWAGGINNIFPYYLCGCVNKFDPSVGNGQYDNWTLS